MVSLYRTGLKVSNKGLWTTPSSVLVQEISARLKRLLCETFYLILEKGSIICPGKDFETSAHRRIVDMNAE